MLAQSRRALEYLSSENLFTRATANWTLGYAYTLQGDRAAARQAFTEAISLSQTSGAIFSLILATIGLGLIQELDNQLHQAAETYRYVLQLAGDHPQQIINEADLGLARVLYEWNDLDAAEQHTHLSIQLARQYESIIDRSIIAEVFLARLKLAQGNVDAAAAILAKTDESVRQYNFIHRMPEIAAAQVLTFLRQGYLAEAARLAQTYGYPLSQARVLLAQGDPSAAQTMLAAYLQQVEAKKWQDERLKTMVLQSVAQSMQGAQDQALQVLHEALALAEPEGYVRIFVDQGAPVAALLAQIAGHRMQNDATRHYAERLLVHFSADRTAQNGASSAGASTLQPPGALLEPLSDRELEVLQLLGSELNGPEIARELMVSLNTMRTHTKNIYAKLAVNNRRAAVRRAGELHLV